MPKYIATLDFSGIHRLEGNHKRGVVYDYVESDAVKLMLKIGYLKEFKENVVSPELVTIQKELNTEIETKELKVEVKTKGRKKKING